MTRFTKERTRACLRLRFRPADARAVLDSKALLDLRSLLQEAANDPSIALVVLEGARDDLFAAGADLRTIAALEPGEVEALSEQGGETLEAIRELPACLVAVVRGACYGGGFDLALAADVVVALPGARFAHPGPRIGIITGWGGTYRLPKRLGPLALGLLRAGEPIEAPEAIRIGLVDVLVRDEAELAGVLESWERRAAELRELKRALNGIEGLGLTAALRMECALRGLSSVK